MAHVHSIYDTDLHFIIDPISRKITSESGKVILMQKDHNSERFTFEIPRFVEGHDMSLSDQVQVHYINLESVSPKRRHEDMYPVLDVQVSPDSDDVVIFSWLVSGNATQYVGSLNFLVRFVCYDGSDITYQWWSDTCSTIKIGATFDNTDSAVDLDDTDILESWRQECIQAVFESDVFSELEAQGTNYVNQAKAYAEQAKEFSGLDKVEAITDKIQVLSQGSLVSPGWYRFFEFTASQTAIQGATANSCDVWIKAGFGNTPASVYRLLLMSRHADQQFKLLASTALSADNRSVSKIRYTHDGISKAYLEIYYTKSMSNTVSVTLSSSAATSSGWKPIAPTLTQETVDGVTVTTTYDLPANASPVTDLDLANYLPLTGGDINGNLGLVSTDEVYRTFKLKNANREILIRIASNGTFQIIDITDGLVTELAGSAVGGKLQINGTTTGNLPLDGGGEVKRADAIPIRVKNTIGNTAYTRYSGKDGVLGFLGMGGENKPTYMDKDGIGKDLLHTGNMASHVLPLTGGGVVSADKSIPVALKNNSADSTYLQYVGKSGSLGYVGFLNANRLVYMNSASSEVKDILHIGNMADYVILKNNASIQSIKCPSTYPLVINNTHESSDSVSIGYYVRGTMLGRVGVDSTNNPIFIKADNTVTKILHDGNSAKLHTAATTPPDTSYVWIT